MYCPAGMECVVIFVFLVKMSLWRVCDTADLAICPDAMDETWNLVLYRLSESRKFNNTIRASERTTYLQGASCPDDGTYFNMAKPRRVCPHKIFLNYDPDRVPVFVFEAKCSCQKCLGTTGFGSGTCKPVYYYRNVHYGKSDKGKRCYHTVVRRFSVGCQCTGTDKPTPQRTSPNK